MPNTEQETHISGIACTMQRSDHPGFFQVRIAELTPVQQERILGDEANRMILAQWIPLEEQDNILSLQSNRYSLACFLIRQHQQEQEWQERTIEDYLPFVDPLYNDNEQDEFLLSLRKLFHTTGHLWEPGLCLDWVNHTVKTMKTMPDMLPSRVHLQPYYNRGHFFMKATLSTGLDNLVIDPTGMGPILRFDQYVPFFGPAAHAPDPVRDLYLQSKPATRSMLRSS